MANRKKVNINIATAKVADGEVKSTTQIYDICGVKTSNYRTANLEEYTNYIKSLNLVQLQDEAYQHSVLASSNRDVIIDNLTKKFIREVGKFGAKSTAPGNDLRQQALNVLARGR